MGSGFDCARDWETDAWIKAQYMALPIDDRVVSEQPVRLRWLGNIGQHETIGNDLVV